jgi:hypothetical protein
MVSLRRGRSSLGCLFTLLVISVLIYVGVKVGEVYWRAYEFKDAMKQEVRFAAQIPDDRMLRHLRAVADSLGLPDEAQEIQISRSKGSIVVETQYDEEVELPLVVRRIHFAPRAEGTY